MSSQSTTSTHSVRDLDQALSRLERRLAGLGITFSVWDLDGRCVRGPEPACEFCRLLLDSSDICRQAVEPLVERACGSEEGVQGRSAAGCVLVALPLWKRRRRVGVAVCEFPTLDSRDEETLHRVCGCAGLDCPYVASLARDQAVRSAEAARHWQAILRGLLEHEQAGQATEEELANLSGNLAVTYEELSLLYRVSGSMRVTRRPEDFLQTTCEELLEVMNMETAAAATFPRGGRQEDVASALAGNRGSGEHAVREFLESQIAPLFEQEHRPRIENDCTDPFGLAVLAEGVRNWVAVPLVSEDRLIGVLAGLNKIDGEFDSVDLKLINAVGNQASIFLTNNYLYGEMRDLLMGVLHALTAAIDAKDPYTCGHSQRVALISKRIAEAHGLPFEKVRQVYLAGLLHDVGKIGVPEAVLTKSGRLTEGEFESIKTHPATGAKILGGIRHLGPIIQGILTHHERPDGRGYPSGLTEDQVPIEGKIVGLADAFDAMTSSRTYRKALPLDVAIEEIRANAGRQFDPQLAQTFLSLDMETFLAELKGPAEVIFPASLLAPEPT